MGPPTLLAADEDNTSFKSCVYVWGRRDWGDFYFLHHCSAFLMNLFIHLFHQNLESLCVSLLFFKTQKIESSMAGFSFSVLLSCLSGSQLQAVGDCGQEEVHATVLHGAEPHLTEPAPWHRGGFRGHTSGVVSAVRKRCSMKHALCIVPVWPRSLCLHSHIHSISPLRYDFYLISQAACRGTVNPTYYNVIYDDNGLKPDHMQRLTFKLCHLYYNWPVSDSRLLTLEYRQSRFPPRNSSSVYFCISTPRTMPDFSQTRNG